MTAELEPVTGQPVAVGGLADGRDLLLARLTASWLASFGSHHTVTAYRRDLGYWLAWCDAIHTPPLDVRVADVNDWTSYQRERGAQGDGQSAAPRSIARRLSVIASWYGYLVENTAGDPDPLIGHNPAAAAKRPKVDRDASPTIGLTRAEADQLIAAADADGPRSSAFVRLMLTNAVRCDTICTMAVPDLGWDRGHQVLTQRVKGDKLLRMPLPPPTAQAIDDYLASRGNPAEGRVFVTSTGGPVDEARLFRVVQKLARRAKVNDADRISPHSLRHTAITEALEATNGNVPLVQDMAGHADPRTTMLYNRRRGQLDGHAAYILAGRYGAGGTETTEENHA